MINFLELVGETYGVNIHKGRGRRFLWLFIGFAALSGLLIAALTPWKAFAIMVALVVLLAAYLKPEYVLLGLAVYTPFEPFLLKFVSDDIYLFARYFSEGLIYVLAAVVIIRALTGAKKLVHTPIDLSFVFFLLTAVASLVLNAVPPVYGILGIRQIIRFILLFFITVYLNPDRTFIRRMTYAMLGIVLFEGVLGFVQSFVGAPMDQFLIPSQHKFFESIQLTSGTTQFWSPGTRVFATMGRFDQLGTFLCFFFLIAAGLWYELKRKVTRRNILIVVALAFPALILTLSRASWFGFFFGLFFIAVILMRDRRVLYAYIGVILAFVLYLGGSHIAIRYLVDYPSATPMERLLETFSYESIRGQFYGLGRVYWAWETLTVVVPGSPLFGWGPGQYGGGAAAALGNVTVYQKLNLPFGVYGTDGYIDNNWFSLWGETGTIGLVFYFWMFAALAFMAYKVWKGAKDPLTKGLALGFMGCLLAVTFQAFLATYLEVRTLALYLWVYAAFVYVLGRREKVFS